MHDVMMTKIREIPLFTLAPSRRCDSRELSIQESIDCSCKPSFALRREDDRERKLGIESLPSILQSTSLLLLVQWLSPNFGRDEVKSRKDRNL